MEGGGELEGTPGEIYEVGARNGEEEKETNEAEEEEEEDGPIGGRGPPSISTKRGDGEGG